MSLRAKGDKRNSAQKIGWVILFLSFFAEIQGSLRATSSMDNDGHIIREEAEGLFRNRLSRNQCSAVSTLHDKNPSEYKFHYDTLEQTQNLLDRSKLNTFKMDDSLLTQTLHDEGRLIIWDFGIRQNGVGTFTMSAYCSDKMILGDFAHQEYISPPFQKSNIGSPTKVVQGDHAVYIMSWYSEYQHILLDHLGYIAYLRKTLPPHTKLLLPRVSGHPMIPNMLQSLDPEFAGRVDWIECHSWRSCNNHILVRNGTLRVLTPAFDPRHVDLLSMARQWIHSSFPPSPEQLQKNSIIYYKRGGGANGAKNGRVMDQAQEELLIQMLRDTMLQHGRQEQLVLFDGRGLSFEQQVRIFQSATAVIGPHGGGLANMLFLPLSGKCQERPVVLEFATSPRSPQVQGGDLNISYYNMFSTCPWTQYHHILFTAESTCGVTYVDMELYSEALKSIFGGHLVDTPRIDRQD
jgi:hypothetical protein